MLAADLLAARTESESRMYSPYVEIVVNPEIDFRVAVIAPERPAAEAPWPALPTIFAVSGEEQRHVSKFFRSWKAEKKGWQVVIPLRPKTCSAMFFEGEGLDLIMSCLTQILQKSIPGIFPVESSKVHLVGTSNGGASVLAMATHLPSAVASLSLVTGFVPNSIGPEMLQQLRSVEGADKVPWIRMFAGDRDRYKQDKELLSLHARLENVLDKKNGLQIQILPGVGHSDIGHNLDPDSFWSGFEQAAPGITGTVYRLHALAKMYCLTRAVVSQQPLVSSTNTLVAQHA
eukprot:gnl/MRDRNA2_/MRDRNA2_43515_c0_seq1.p1 gnl/MRDRNA2_/MRDRNA2_43515_c0~~gnl/MRDRNA2_/MRDRNA2_43515_c0_seq1.p1  ORF type:complete len:288 (-),score=54.94 gnl/MRDRNA2_/MRDRNA2_43515_c0_seq1:218-1081(-)